MSEVIGIIVAGNFFVVIIALIFNLRVLRDKTKQDYILPWKFVFLALIFFLLFEVVGVLDQMGVITILGLSNQASFGYALTRLGILACFLFGLVLEDKHEIVEQKMLVARMKDGRKVKTKSVGKYVKKNKPKPAKAKKTKSIKK